MLERNTISRVVLRNYKSIRECDVTLGPITFLVGPNGAGKSNFVEALHFLASALSTSLQAALDSRSGFHSIARGGTRGEGLLHERRLSIEIFFQLAGDVTQSRYLLEMGVVEGGSVAVTSEECNRGEAWFKANQGIVRTNQGFMPAAYEDKLYLVNASGLPAFEPAYRALSSISVYNPVPDEIRGPKLEKRYRLLDRVGSTLGEAVNRLKSLDPDRFARVVAYLHRINPSVYQVDASQMGSTVDLQFRLDRGVFLSQSMSDGTLRGLAVLVALFQKPERFPLTLVGLEEPEAGLHPAAAAVLFDALMEGSHLGQVIVTSHSPDLLDRPDIPENSLRAVVMHEGRTIIGEIDHAGKSALTERLYTAGELMRMDQLLPEGLPDAAYSR